MKKILWRFRYFAAMATIILCLALGVVLFPVVGIWTDMIAIHALESRMQSPEIYQPIAQDLALFCQSFGDKLGEQKALTVERDWLPDSIRKLPPFEYCSVEPGVIYVVFGGGFYHFGYALNRDENSADKQVSVWHLNLKREDQPDVELTTVRLPESAKLNMSEFVQNVLQRYEQDIAHNPQELELYKQQLFFGLKFASRREAVKNLHTAASNMPDHWWPPLALDWVESDSGPVTTQDRFANWVETHPSFSHYGDLVWLDRLENKPDEAAKAAEMMLAATPSDESDDIQNFYGRTEDVAAYFYQIGNPKLALRFCEKMEPFLTAGSETSSQWFAPQFAVLKAACLTGDKAPIEKLSLKDDQDIWTDDIFSQETQTAFAESKP